MTASTPDKLDTIAPILLGWYAKHARTLPWRAPPETAAPDPYRVWLSEVMLQQTTTAAVAPYFRKFTERWTDVQALAAAPEDEVMAAWAGLGYYSRARNLVACAKIVADIGGFPETEQELLKLPGVGAYTAAAIAAIAFGRRAVVVDANVERVVARLFAIDEPLPKARKAIGVATGSITPEERSGDFAQAMMDLGATICTAREPRCLLCPLSQNCLGRAGGDPAAFPVKPPKKAKPVRQGNAYWIQRGDEVWLVKREGKGMLGGMKALPSDDWHSRADGSGDAPIEAEWTDAGLVRHAFTHFSIEMSVRSAVVASERPTDEGEWWPISRLDDAGLPTLFAKAAALASALRDQA